MSQSSSELSKRVVTAFCGVSVILALVGWGGWPGICFVAFVLSLVMAYELATMIYSLPDQRQKLTIFLLLAVAIHFVHFVQPGLEAGLATAAFLLVFTYFLFTATRHGTDGLLAHLKEMTDTVFGLLYVVFLPLFLAAIHALASGTRWTLLFLLIVWMGDTMAYFAGKKFGKTKLYSFISPKKTVQGALGGLLSGILISVLFRIWFFPELPWLAACVIPVLVGVAAQIGDFCESFLKRAYNKKDSGSILPGHGGFLDRFDGVVFSLPVMYACIRAFASL